MDEFFKNFKCSEVKSNNKVEEYEGQIRVYQKYINSNPELKVYSKDP